MTNLEILDDEVKYHFNYANTRPKINNLSNSRSEKNERIDTLPNNYKRDNSILDEISCLNNKINNIEKRLSIIIIILTFK